jgi:hypothetical protein
MVKRGQAAGGAAILIIVIAAILVIYILFLDPVDRADLLGEDDKTSSEGQTSAGFNKTLLDESIGRLDYLRFDYREHEIPSFRINAQTEGSILKSIRTVYVQNGVGNDKYYNLSFSIDKSLTNSVFLAFNIKSSSGKLIIKLNGRELFYGYLDKGSMEPMSLPLEFLEKNNVLTFEVSSPGFAFWRTNEYSLDNVMLTGDVLDLSNSVSRQFFYISDLEKNNLDTVKLKFFPNCDVSSSGPLNVYFNGAQVSSGIVDCGIYNIIALDKNDVFEDRNELEFIVTEGSYFVDRITVRTDLESLLYPVYYFDLDEDLFEGEELKNEFNVSIHLRFVNDDEKLMEYLINGRRKHISTQELSYEAVLDDYVFAGTNSLELVPKSVIDIASLKVMLEEE